MTPENPWIPRSTSTGRSPQLRPWQRAETMSRCALYWMPITAFPAPRAERAWLLDFTARLSSHFKTALQADPMVFLQYKTAYDLVHDDFIRHSRKFMPLMGLGRRPGTDLPEFPPNEVFMEAFYKGTTIDAKKYIADYAYLFLCKSDAEIRQLFGCLGGMTLLYRKADPKTKPPEITVPPRYRDHELFKTVDVPGLLAGACSLQDEFLPKSKVVFGAGMAKNVQVESMPFILPLLSTTDFFQMKDEDLTAAFELFDVYFHESPSDHGMVLSSKHDLDDILVGILDEMRRAAP